MSPIVVRVNRQAADELNGLLVPFGHERLHDPRGPGELVVKSVPLWGLRLWSLFERVEDAGRSPGAFRVTVVHASRACTRLPDGDAHDLAMAVEAAAAVSLEAAHALALHEALRTASLPTRPVEGEPLVGAVVRAARRWTGAGATALPVSEAYDGHVRVFLPPDLREAGELYVADRLVLALDGGEYAVRGCVKRLFCGVL